MDTSALNGVIASIPSTTAPSAAGKAAEPATGAPGFTDSLGRLLESVEAKAGDANTAVGEMLNGTGDVHDAMIALQRADMALQLTVQVRNKLVQAYQEIMRMPV